MVEGLTRAIGAYDEAEAAALGTQACNPMRPGMPPAGAGDARGGGRRPQGQGGHAHVRVRPQRLVSGGAPQECAHTYALLVRDATDPGPTRGQRGDVARVRR